MRTEPGIAEAKANKPKGRKVLTSIEIRRPLDGGHVVTHNYEGYQQEPDKFKFAKSQGHLALTHIAKHTGLPMPESEEPEETDEAEDEAEE